MIPTIILVHGAFADSSSWNGFAPDAGESAFTLAANFPGSTLGDAVGPTPRSDGTTDLTIAQELFHDRFCADVPADQAARMAVTQRASRRPSPSCARRSTAPSKVACPRAEDGTPSRRRDVSPHRKDHSCHPRPHPLSGKRDS